MSDSVFVDGWLFVMREAFEGGQPGQGTAFLDGTAADSTGNHGLLATLVALSPEQASEATALGTSVAAHAAHIAYHLEAGARMARGDRGPYDWASSFEPAQVDAAAWSATRQRVQAAYEQVVALARGNPEWDVRSAGGLAAFLAHAAYHLGAIRQLLKLLD